MSHSVRGEIKVRDPSRLWDVAQAAWDCFAFVRPAQKPNVLEYIVNSEHEKDMRKKVTAANVAADAATEDTAVEPQHNKDITKGSNQPTPFVEETEIPKSERR